VGLASWKRALLWLPPLVIAAYGIVAAIGFAPGSRLTFDAPPQSWERLANQMHRPIRGRLGATLLYRPCPQGSALCGPPPSLSSQEFRQLSVLLARLARESVLDPVSLHIGALASLMIDGPESIAIIERLEAAAALAPSETAIASDLVAARLAFATANHSPGGDPGLAAQQELLAMREVVTLVARAPDEPAVWFNYALTLETVGLPHSAEDAWRRFLGIEPVGPWADEVRQHLSAQPGKIISPGTAPDDLVALEAWAEAHPHEARRLVEESLLSKWAQEENTLESEKALRSLEVIAPILAHQLGDYILLDTLGSIRRASAAERAVFAATVRSYQDGMVAYGEQRFTDALTGFSEIRESLSRSEVSFLGWVDYRVAASLYGLDRFEEAGAILRAMDIDANRCQVLESRRLWLLALVEGTLGRLYQSVTLSEQALEILVRHRDLAAVASMNVNLAGPLDQLSQPGRAWMHRLQGLRASSRLGSFRLRHVALIDAASQLIELGEAEPALPFLAELVRNAEEWGPATARLEAHLLHSSALSTAGRHREASEQLLKAGTAAGELEDPNRVLRLSADIAVERAEILITTDPAGALEELDRSLTIYQGFEYTYPLVRVHRLRGVAARRLGWEDKVGDAYRAAVAAHDAVLAGLETPEHRAGYLVHSRDAYDSLVRYLAVEVGDAEEAFAVVEKSRGVWTDGANSVNIGLRDLQAALPDDTALVAYRVLATETLAWWVRAHESDFLVLPVGRSDLAAEIERHEAEIALSSGTFSRDSATAALYQHLIAPLGVWPVEVRRLLVIPDRNLGQIAFPSLFNQHSGRFLMESLDSLTMLPSARVPVGLTAMAPRRGVLAVGDPAFDAERFPALMRLPAAAEEAAEVAALHRDAVLLLGDEARRSRVLEELRGRRILHYAGHALIDPRHPERGALLLAPDGRDDGLVAAEDWVELSRSGLDLVVLSACRTSVSRGSPTQDWVEVLLNGGVRGVVAGRGEVDDESARRFFNRFHSLLLAGLDGPEAVLAAQKSFRAEPPRMWANFSYYGLID
jgi:CHAT domain-containing protein/tetratricopeptide (TPR) repeat protein